jgi:choline dehydrogenase
VGYDVIVVGGGSAGGVLAARLSEDRGRRVLLIEAGPDHVELSATPADVLDAAEPTLGHDWGYSASVGERTISVPRGKIMGGCSATNACFALRGAPEVYDAWAAAGNRGWAFADVLDDFRRLEHDADLADEWHGRDGPVPIRRYPSEELNRVQAAFCDAAVASGHAAVADHNRPGAVGVGPSPRNVRDGVRMSTALTYLAVARGRANLTIRPDTFVACVETSANRATGVRLLDGTLVEADRVVLAAGTYASPLLLARSGIGPAADLRALGIEPVADLPGVGSHLIDHPLVAVDLPCGPAPGVSRFQVHLSLHSSYAERAGPSDLMLFCAGPFQVDDDVSPGGAVFGIVAGVLAPTSRGRVWLRSTSPTDPPRIDLAHLAERGDLDRMLDAVTEARRLAGAEALAAVMTGAELAPGPDIPSDDRVALGRWARASVSTFHHPVGTCAMGPDPAQGAVTDERGAVHGVAGLTVADASIMPTIPTATTNLPTMMVAEHVAALLRAG